jgi:mRNA interferase RelE/StbE
MNYEVKILRGAVKQLELLPNSDYLAVKSKIISLSQNPRPPGYIKLKGRQGYRVRQGNHRIIYDIFDDVLIVRIIRIGHRKDVYR